MYVWYNDYWSFIIMRRVVALAFLIFAFASCEPVKTDTFPGNDNNVITDVVSNDSNSNVIKLPISTGNEESEKTLDNVVWINPGKVYITNLFFGSQAEWIIRIHNEKNVPNVFSVYYKVPDYVEKGYERLPDKFSKWIIVNKTITIAPDSIGETLVTVKMSDQAYSKKYEAWIAVMDESQTGMIRTELCSRWFISTQ